MEATYRIHVIINFAIYRDTRPVHSSLSKQQQSSYRPTRNAVRDTQSMKTIHEPQKICVCIRQTLFFCRFASGVQVILVIMSVEWNWFCAATLSSSEYNSSQLQ